MRKKLIFIALVMWQTIFAQTNVNIQVNASLGKKSISPFIYGKNNNISDNPGNPTSAAQWGIMREAGLRFTRENGGNNATKYNWRRKLSSHPDWYNNVYAHDWDYAARSLHENMPWVQGMWAFQLIGKAAKTGLQNFNDWGYNGSKWWSGVCQNLAGGGTLNSAGGCTALTNGNPSLYLENWNADSTVGILDHWFGSGGLGYSVNDRLYWSMDNEPEIWNGTHDDVMPTLLSAEAFMQQYFEVAKKARARFPAIKLCGPVPANEWQWYNWNGDRITTGGKSYVWLEYFIKRCAEEQIANGIRLLDVLDIHNYPGETSNADIVQLYRIFFDSTYNYPGANGVKRTGSSAWDNSITKEYIFGRCRQWLNQYMGPGQGVTFGVSEYGANNTNANVTSVNYASLLGTFADNNVEFFTPWSWYPGMWETLHLFSRYSKNARVQSLSDNEQDVSAYSSINSAADSLTVILVNRSLTLNKNTTVHISNFNMADGSYQTFQLAQLPSTETFVSHTNNALIKGNIQATANAFTLSLPALSTTAIILKGQGTTGVIHVQNFDEEITLYPNPNSGFFNLNYSTIFNGEVGVYNLLGEQVFKTPANSKFPSTIDLGDQKNGIYIIRFNTGKSMIVKKIIIKN